MASGPKPFAKGMDGGKGMNTSNSGYKVPRYTQATLGGERGRAVSNGPKPFRGTAGSGAATPKGGGGKGGY